MVVNGIVKKGKQLCTKTHGFPTANIETHLEIGVYTGRSKYGKCIVTVNFPPLTEVHILNFKGDLYEKPLTIYRITRVPDEITDMMRLVWNKFIKPKI